MSTEYFLNEFEEDKNVFILDRDDKYVANFGKQWRDHVDIQIDNTFSSKYHWYLRLRGLLRLCGTTTSHWDSYCGYIIKRITWNVNSLK